MLTEIEVFAPAKVNIGLKVLPRLENEAYHKIESIFQTVNIKDKLNIKLTDGFDEITVESEAFPLPKENTITKAYEAFKETLGIEKMPSVHVVIEKHIPMGGGLGGGSSDAAAFVKGLEKLMGTELRNEQYDSIAGAVGSDVFFFFHCNEKGDACAVVTGRGEIVQDIGMRDDLHFLLAFPGINSSTKEAYQLVDECHEKGLEKNEFPALEVLEKMYRSPLNCWRFVNSFTPPLTRRYPEIADALAKIKEAGALFSDMSGSGSTVFGIFSSRKDAERAADLLRSKGVETALA